MDRPRGRQRRAVAGATAIIACAAALLACGYAPRGMTPQLPPTRDVEGPAEPVFLLREVVSLEIRDGSVEGRAFYHFRNPETVARAFPAAVAFFAASWQGLPEAVQFSRVAPDLSEQVPFVWLEQNRPLAQLLLAPGDSYCMRVDWTQAVSANRFVYLLRREPPWPMRRENLRVTLQAPRDFRSVLMNYRYSRKFKSETHQSFMITRNDFDPPENLEVTWAP